MRARKAASRLDNGSSNEDARFRTMARPSPRAGADRQTNPSVCGREGDRCCRIFAALVRAVDLRLRHARELQSEGHVLGQIHMRIQRTGLEHHGNAALGGRQFVHAFAVDGQVPLVISSSPAIMRSNVDFAAARRADEHDELAIPDVEVHIARSTTALVGLTDLFRTIRLPCGLPSLKDPDFRLQCRQKYFRMKEYFKDTLNHDT